MRLNMDLVREILLCVEKNTGLHKGCYFIDEEQMESVCFAMGEETEPIQRYQKDIIDSGKAYDSATLFYHVVYCAEAGFLKTAKGAPTYRVTVEGLSVSGHEFVENIREEKRWKALKEKLRAVGSFALSVAAEAAKEMAIIEIRKNI